ncbi:MAG: hypothetical protein GY822_14260 [Deltaproteobacteria bacterium]|nr:hypothetical protein [Deltaproteobacteria bacterium]
MIDVILPLLDSGRILGQTTSSLGRGQAAISTKRGVAFVEHRRGEIALRSEVELFDAPRDMTFVDDVLYFAGEHGVVSVQAPCPPFLLPVPAENDSGLE